MSGKPTADEIMRVMQHQQREKALMCQHPEVRFGVDSGPICTECDRPVRFWSDIQIEDIQR